MMQLKTENIELLERLSGGESSKREEHLKRMEGELVVLRRELVKSNGLMDDLKAKNE
jgi:hypothetical protein